MMDLWIGVTAVGGREIFHLGRKPAPFEFAYVNHHGTGNPVFKNTDPIVFWNQTEHKFQLQGFLASPTKDGVAIFSGPFGTNFEKELWYGMSFGLSPGHCCVEVAGLPSETIKGYIKQESLAASSGLALAPPGHKTHIVNETYLTIMEANHALQMAGIETHFVSPFNISDLEWNFQSQTGLVVFTNGEWIVVPKAVFEALEAFSLKKKALSPSAVTPLHAIDKAMEMAKKSVSWATSDKDKALKAQALAKQMDAAEEAIKNPPKPVQVDMDKVKMGSGVCWRCDATTKYCECPNPHFMSVALHKELCGVVQEVISAVKDLGSHLSMTKRVDLIFDSHSMKTHHYVKALKWKTKDLLGLM